jgi:formamidopyrimidine-DNA glycosylase
MPELPEVETVRRQIIEHVLHKKISKVDVMHDKMVGGNVQKFSQEIIGKEFSDLTRRGKYLFFELNDGNWLVGHLKMTGQFVYQKESDKAVGGGHNIKETFEKLPHKHSHIIFTFADNSRLFYNDTRRFGYIHFKSKDEKKIIENKLGIDPTYKEEFSRENFAKLFTPRKANIKAFLLDQKYIAGLGNIYVDEICFRSGILPTRKLCEINKNEIGKLYKNCVNIINEALEAGGTTFYSFRDSEGNKGTFFDFLQVFHRDGKPCKKCGTIIEKIRHAGRGTHFCPKCQK